MRLLCASGYRCIFIFRPPPLCGAIPPLIDYIAKPGDKVASRVPSMEEEEQWILAEVSSQKSSYGYKQLRTACRLIQDSSLMGPVCTTENSPNRQQ